MKESGSKAAFKRIAWGLFSGIWGKSHSWFPVLTGPARGAWLHLDLRSQSSYFLGTYDRWIYERVPLHRMLSPGQAAWDCGSFVGYYAAIFRKRVGPTGEVLVFEASRANYEALHPMPQRNGWNNVRIFHEAVGPENTSLTFVNNLGGASGPVGLGKDFSTQGQAIETIEVRSLGIDEIRKTRASCSPQLLKLDLEAGEIHALKNGAEVFGHIRPYVMLELHGEEAGKAANQWLKEYEYDGVVIEKLPKWASLGSDAYLKAYRSLSGQLGGDVRSVGYLPHMLFCIPKEKEPHG